MKPTSFYEADKLCSEAISLFEHMDKVLAEERARANKIGWLKVPKDWHAKSERIQYKAFQRWHRRARTRQEFKETL
jgi:hypothetical protein